jgi:hypothetical protein
LERDDFFAALRKHDVGDWDRRGLPEKRRASKIEIIRRDALQIQPPDEIYTGRRVAAQLGHSIVLR